MTSDYFPLKGNNEWVFDVTEENNYQITVKVENIEVVEGDSLFNVDFGGDTYYFQRKLGTVKRIRELFTTYDGERVDFATVYEPYLLQKGFIVRTPRGRVATEKAYKHLNKNYKKK